MSQECVKQGVCRRCGSSCVVTSEPHGFSGMWCSRTATCVKCFSNEEYVYELTFIGYEKPGADDIIPVPDDDAIERLANFRLEVMPEGCEEEDEGAPFLSEAVLYPLIGKTDARAILDLWKKISAGK